MSLKVNSSNLAKAEQAWGHPLPDWVRLLADHADRVGQRGVGDRIGRNAATVSRIINACYPGDLAEAEQLIRANLGAEQVACPLWGTIPLASCMSARRRKLPPQNHKHRSERRVCPNCTNNSDREEN